VRILAIEVVVVESGLVLDRRGVNATWGLVGICAANRVLRVRTSGGRRADYVP